MTQHFEGIIEPQFSEVSRIFLHHFEVGLDVGAALCIYYQNQPVVDLWAGHATPTLLWSQDTLVPLTSLTKAILSIVILVLAQQGVVDVDAPICDYWPEFGTQGKAEISLRWALSHQAGIPAFDHPITLEEQINRRRVIESLASMRPIWHPGSAHGYHAITLGFLLTEVLSRITGHESRFLIQQMLQIPLNAEVYLGLRRPDITRVTTMIPPPDDISPKAVVPQELKEYLAALLNKTSLMYRATFGSTTMTFEDMNNPQYYMAERPAAYGTAAGVARLFASLVGDINRQRLLMPPWVDKARAVQCDGTDLVFKMRTSWGLGFLLPNGPLWPNFGTRAFGHIGSSGAIAFADPENKLAFAFLPNKMKSVLECTDRRVLNLIQATYKSL